MGFSRRGSVAAVLAAVAIVGTAPTVAVAAPPNPSAVQVSDTTLTRGQQFTVSFELFNPEAFTVTGANASLRTLEGSIVDVLELVSCTGSNSVCHDFFTTYRGPVGDLAANAQRTVVFTFRVRETAPLGNYTLEHQFVGGNFAFAPATGPVLSIAEAPQVADLAVSLDASPRGILTSRITYVVTVENNGPADATGVRVTGTFANGLSWSGSSGCVRDGSRGVICDFASIPAGDSASASFSVNAGLLSLGSFSTDVARVASSPTDPDGSNDSARRTCAALTGLLVRC